jgi:hypothetical protein
LPTAPAARCATSPAARCGRLEIAAALLHRPRLLLLDEATVGLDVKARADILNHVRQLVAEQGISVLWATHLFDEIGSNDDLWYCTGRVLRTAGSARHRRSRRPRHPRRIHRLTGWCNAGRLRHDSQTIGPMRSGLSFGQYLTCLKWHSCWREGLRFLHQRERFVSALVRHWVWLFIFAVGFPPECSASPSYRHTKPTSL